MIFSSLIVTIFFQIFVQEKVSSLDLSAIPDPVEVMCVVLKFLPFFTQYDQEKVEFLLWTSTNPGDNDYYKLDPFNLTNLQSSPFNGTRKTCIFVHGYTDTGTAKWILKAKTKIIDFEDANIISVNFWQLVAKPSNTDLDYPPAVCNSYKVGNFSAHFFDWLSQNSNLNASRMHIIGHSLGAHTAGVMAHYMIELSIGKVSRVTGLDPAGVLYSKLINKFRLDKYQAHFVDIIHTNGCDIPAIVCFGLKDEIGHVDFFPNGGILQPGCNITNFANCSHERAPDLYVESIQPLDKEFKSWPCESCIRYLFKLCTKCHQSCLNMGYNVPTNLTGTYNLSTNGESPFAKGDDQDKPIICLL